MAVRENETMMNKMVDCRKHLKQQIVGLLAGIFAFVWWCVFYPELCFPQDVYEAVYETESELAEEAEENCRGLLQAEEEQVIVKSRLLEWLERRKE